MKIRKYQWAGNIIAQDNTRVQRPLIIKPVKRTLKPNEFFYNDNGVVRVGRLSNPPQIQQHPTEVSIFDRNGNVVATAIRKNAQVSQDNRSQKQRKLDQTYAEQKSKQIRMQQAERETAEALGNIATVTLPNHLIGAALSDKPLFEAITDPSVTATNNDLINFGIDMLSPGKFIKGFSTAAILGMPGYIKGFKSLSDIKPLVTQSQYNFLKAKPKEYLGLSRFEWYNKHGSLNSNDLRTFKAIMKIAETGSKGKKGGADELKEILAAKKASTEDGQLELIRSKFQKGIDQVNSESRRGILQLDWSDLNNGNHLGGMPGWLKLEKVGFNEKPFLERYLSNVITKVRPKQKELLDKGLLRPTKDGKHWEGLVNGEYIQVDPYRYIISKLERAEAYGNKVDVRPELEAIIPRHGTSGRKGVGKEAKHMTNPSLEYDQTLYTVEADRSPGANAGIKYFRRNNGASVPLMRKPQLEPKYYQKGRTGNSNSSGVADGAKGEVIETPRGVSDPQAGGQPMNEYNFGPGVDNIKSYWNTLDFQYGAGPLAFIMNKESNNIV